ncbi:hypothetical protein OEA41_002322 [Lepraria neglecta]|uniref:Uncharacterized protein n=1 Tax=Lepraria neglecta TaxID=209136 RepID=A0AAD9ZCD0_9LECA|nr:hypothetical protein OEA41_002322 [Lepraria neglecta]
MLRLDTSPKGEDVVDNRVGTRTITAAHSSVSNFLSSRSFQIGSERPTRFTKSHVNAVMAEICLVYLHHFLENEDWTDENRKKRPLIWLGARFWHIFYGESFVEPQEEIETTRLNTQILALLTSREKLLKWITLSDGQEDAFEFKVRRSEDHMVSPLYFGALLGLPEIVNVDANERGHQGIYGYGTPPAAACVLGKETIVKALIDRDADPQLAGPEG